MEYRQSQGRGCLSYPPYIFIFIGMHLLLSLCYCLAFDILEANLIVFLLKPGTISLLFLLIPLRTIRDRILAVFVSILITSLFNQWHLVAGNKILVLCSQVAWFMVCWSIVMVRKLGWLMISVSLLLVCIWGVIRQEWLEQQFNAADVYIIDDGISCGANGHCFQYIAAKGRGLEKKRRMLFSSEDYVNIYYSYPKGIPAVNFSGMNGEFSQYLLCDGRLRHVELKRMVICD